MALVPLVRPRVGLGLAAVAVAGAVGAVVAAATADDDVDSGIAGRLLCPVVLERETACAQHRIVVRDRSSRRRVVTVKPDRMGRFRVALRPAAYLVEVRAPAGGRPARMAVRVSPHRFVRLLLAAGPTVGRAEARRLSGR